jgi:hypothetical protein
MTRSKQFAPLGTISHGTHIAADLIPDFVDVLKEYNSSFTLPEEIQDALNRLTDEEVGDDDLLDEYLNDILFDEMNAIAPPYAYFGAHEGDGSDFGYWISQESLEHDIYDGDLIKCDELPDDPSGTYLVVSDHGNMTLYVDGQEMWGVV